MRKPKVENKYNLKPKDIEKAIVLDYKKLYEPPFWRNGVVKAWCLSGGGLGNTFWIGFYDKDAKSYAGKIRLCCSSFDGMCSYDFKKFYDPKEIENEIDLQLQEKLLETLNWLIDEKIIKIEGV